MTSTEETSESRMRDVLGELSMEIAFALPWMRRVVFLQRDMRIDWLISAWISIGALGDSKFSCCCQLRIALRLRAFELLNAQ